MAKANNSRLLESLKANIALEYLEKSVVDTHFQYYAIGYEGFGQWLKFIILCQVGIDVKYTDLVLRAPDLARFNTEVIILSCFTQGFNTFSWS